MDDDKRKSPRFETQTPGYLIQLEDSGLRVREGMVSISSQSSAFLDLNCSTLIYYVALTLEENSRYSELAVF